MKFVSLHHIKTTGSKCDDFCLALQEKIWINQPYTLAHTNTVVVCFTYNNLTGWCRNNTHLSDTTAYLLPYILHFSDEHTAMQSFLDHSYF